LEIAQEHPPLLKADRFPGDSARKQRYLRWTTSPVFATIDASWRKQESYDEFVVSCLWSASQSDAGSVEYGSVLGGFPVEDRGRLDFNFVTGVAYVR
jgi:hypothetical protein